MPAGMEDIEKITVPLSPEALPPEVTVIQEALDVAVHACGVQLAEEETRKEPVTPSPPKDWLEGDKEYVHTLGGVTGGIGTCVGGGKAENKAVTVVSAPMVTVQVLPLPAQPVQPKKTYWPAGVAVKVTVLPEPTLMLQLVPQLMPAGVLVTVPLPVTTAFRVYPVWDTTTTGSSMLPTAGSPSHSELS